MTLYTFDKDTKGAAMSACVDKCIENWPAFLAADGAMAEGEWTLVDVKDKDGAMSSARRELERLHPSLRRYARGLAGARVAADDLVQDCLVLALDRERQFRG